MSVACVGGGSIFSSTSITTPMMNDPTTFTNSVLNANVGPITRMMAIATGYPATEPTKAPRADEQQLLHRRGRTPTGRASGHPKRPQAFAAAPKPRPLVPHHCPSIRAHPFLPTVSVAVVSGTMRMRAAVGVSA